MAPKGVSRELLRYYGPSYDDGYHDFLPKLGTLINKLVLGKLNQLPQLNPSEKPNNQVNKSNSPNLESLQLVKKQSCLVNAWFLDSEVTKYKSIPEYA